MSTTINDLIKKALIPNEEQPYKVPENWSWVKLGDVVEVKRGASPRPKGDPRFFGGTIPWLKISDVTRQGKYIYETQDTVTEAGREKSVWVEPNTLILSISASVGKPCINKVGVCIHDGFVKLSENERLINKNYLYHYLTSALNQMLSKAKGAAQININSSIVKELPVPLPPLNEQKRIAEKLEQFLIKIDEANQLIDEAKETFNLRIESILEKAFRGELTKTWRTGNNSEPQDSSIANDKIPFQIPNSWHWVTLESVCEKITDGTHNSPKSYPIGDYMYITAKNIKKQGVILNNVTYVSKEVHQEIYNRCDVKKGDVLYIKDGATTGIATVNQLSEEFSLLSSVGLLRPKKDKLLPNYLMFCLNSPTIKSMMLGMMSGNAIRRLTIKKIKESIIPLPPVEEQEKIVSVLEKTNAIDEQLVLSTNLVENINNIKQSILYKAFRGELEHKV